MKETVELKRVLRGATESIWLKEKRGAEGGAIKILRLRFGGKYYRKKKGKTGGMEERRKEGREGKIISV